MVVSANISVLQGSVVVVAEGIGVRIGVGIGVGVRMEGRCAGSGCAACMVVFFDGSKAESGIASQFTGHIPVLQKAD